MIIEILMLMLFIVGYIIAMVEVFTITGGIVLLFMGSMDLITGKISK
jgi:hypothetical protein